MVILSAAEQSLIAYTPKTYRTHENDVLEYLPDADGALVAEKLPHGWRIRLMTNLQPGCVSDYLVAVSEEPLIDWTVANCGNYWSNYIMDGTGKWCFDGYYFPTPYNYTPTGENFLYRCPASYFVNSMVAAAKYYRFGTDMSIMMLDTWAQMMNAHGFWPTMPSSGWLMGDYGIPGGFYDTRFNSDLMDLYIELEAHLGSDSLKETMNRYADFFLSFAQQHCVETASGGWLVQDYYHPDVSAKSHTSLNHQLAEIIVLYGLSDSLLRSELADLADKMLLAIEDTAARWIKQDQNLHYSIRVDGSFGGQDYPELTYNDLFDLQKILQERRGERNRVLDDLMAAKYQWMTANNVTGYKK